MPKDNHELDRRDFIKKSAQATAAGAAALSMGTAHGAVPKDKKITLTGTLPTRVLGKTGAELPALGYGGAALPERWGNSLSYEDRVKLVRHAHDQGIRYFDTAFRGTYMESPRIIGEALKDVRDNAFLVTKVDFWERGSTNGALTKVPKGEVARQCEQNLEDLQTDYLDALLIHGTPGVEQMTLEQAMEVHEEMAKLKDQGIVRFIGFSAHSYFQKALDLIETDAFDMCMLAYGYLPRGMNQIFSPGMSEIRNQCVATAHELGMGVVAMKVMAAGMLSGRRQEEFKQLPGAAIRYLFQDERVHILNIGMRFPAEIDANIKALADGAELTDDDRALLAQAGAQMLNSERIKRMKVD